MHWAALRSDQKDFITEGTGTAINCYSAPLAFTAGPFDGVHGHGLRGG